MAQAHPAFREHYGADLTSRLIAGHESDKQDGVQFNGAHMACVPIPSLNEEGLADGLIRRVLLIGLGCEEKNAIELFESVANGINGAALEDHSVKVGYLKKASLNDSVLRLFIRKAVPRLAHGHSHHSDGLDAAWSWGRSVNCARVEASRYE